MKYIPIGINTTVCSLLPISAFFVVKATSLYRSYKFLFHLSRLESCRKFKP